MGRISTVPISSYWGIYLNKNNADGVVRGFFFQVFFVLSSYLNCEAVVFLIKTVIPPFMHLKKGTIQRRSSSAEQRSPHAIQVTELQIAPI